MASNVAGIKIPDGMRLHTENTSHILLDANEAFLNPVQEFNRDMSIACIRVWSEELNRVKEERWRKSEERKAAQNRAPKNGKTSTSTEEPKSMPADVDIQDATVESATVAVERTTMPKPTKEYRPHKVTLLEALSATGLRSIRYAKEIPLLKRVIANDLSPGAVEAMKRNIAINGLGPDVSLEGSSSSPDRSKPRVEVNEGDACSLMYSHREEKKRVDVVDLDPYGTAAPFIDAAVQCVSDGGLLCVTCTDLSVLATTNYPEKCFSNYGGVPAKGEYCHESALRLVLHSLSTSASRYGRFIEPLLSLSIDFYVRIFIRVQTSPIEVKKALAKNSIFYVCTTCQSHYEQPLGRMMTKISDSGHVNYHFKINAGPPVSDKCPECQSNTHVAGPMWSGFLHDTDFVGKVIQHVDANEDHYGTSTRMKGMLIVAKEELQVPFYFTPSKVSSFFHCETPSLDDVASALLNAGHKVSRSHACAGSLKTTASHRQLHDIFRSWIKLHPVKMENISETSPARRLLAVENLTEADFKRHPETIGSLETIRLVRYQENPRGWGPAKKAAPTKTDLKRKRTSEAEGSEEPPAKH
ncbi:N2,N2-dimethylguanosine tRNA methyltransferase [Pholiota conissans]|uniref:tRNA (guanine(26)-N(2))-dimethyltransferase n=1 Tax=Pholiota conissans TaxID=109636 RepID=A0A9P5ZC30_9AGAR|nr:N2,N2-dimethylguanosine tRNA methyltransferase [Pholiota conissans]